MVMSVSVGADIAFAFNSAALLLPCTPEWQYSPWSLSRNAVLCLSMPLAIAISFSWLIVIPLIHRKRRSFHCSIQL